MSPNEYVSLNLPVRATCALTGAQHTIPTPVSVPSNVAYVIPEGAVISNCPTGDGNAISLGEVFYFQQGQIVDTKTIAELRNEWHILFSSCTQGVQILGSDNERMDATISFKIKGGDDFEDQHVRAFNCNVRQPEGDPFGFESPGLEVVVSDELAQQVYYNEFSSAVEDYYRSLVGSTGAGIRTGNATNFVMSGNRFVQPMLRIIRKNLETGSSAW